MKTWVVGVLLLRSFSALALDRPPLALAVGEQRLLRLPGLSRYSVGSESVRVHAVASRPGEPEALLVKGTRDGMADLWVSFADGRSDHWPVRVDKAPILELKAPLERALGRLEETEVLLAAGATTLRGEIHSMSELARVTALVQGYGTEIRNQTTVAEPLLEQGRRRLEAWLATTPWGHALRVERVADALWVRGSLERPADRATATRGAQAAFAGVEVDIDSLPDASPTVRFQVYLLELRKNRFSSLGLGWPGSQEGAFHVSSSAIQDAVALDLRLQALEGTGDAHLLSNPELVVRAPGEAELFAGGELPIKTQTQYESHVTWKTFGLTLRLKVAQSTAQQVRLEIFTEVSHLDPTIALADVPGMQANRMRTQVDARYGVPLLLSGLLQKGTRQSARGLPWLRRIPILGALFGSEDYLNESSELVAILMPSTTPPPARAPRVSRELRDHPDWAAATGVASANSRNRKSHLRNQKFAEKPRTRRRPGKHSRSFAESAKAVQ